MSSAHQLVERSLAAIWHPCTQMQRHLHPDPARRIPLLPVARAEGPWLFDPDGNRYFDAFSSWWTTLFGHCHPHIVAAVREQITTLDHVLLAGCTHAPAVELAERLAAKTDGTLGHAFFASDGASAVEIALKLAAHYWRNQGYPEKHRFVAFAGGYHGETVGALAVTDIPIFREAYEPLIRPAAMMPSPDTRRGPNAAHETLAALAEYLAEHHTETAAVIVEPLVQGAGGMAMHPPSFLNALRDLCTRHDVLLIFDEIAVGCGRTGRFFAHEHAGVRPDLLTLSKGITGGTLPLAVVLARDELFRAFLADEVTRAFLHSHSYTGNPLACRAACATLDLLDNPEVWPQIETLGAAFEAAMTQVAAQVGGEHLRRTGTIVAFDLPDAPADFAPRVAKAALAAGLLLRPLGNTCYVMPPFATPPELAEWFGTQLLRTLTQVLETTPASDCFQPAPPQEPPLP